MDLHHHQTFARAAPTLRARSVKPLSARSLATCHAIRLQSAPTLGALAAERFIENGWDQRPQLNGAAS